MPVKNRNLAIVLGALVLCGLIVYIYSSYLYKPLNEKILASRKTADELKIKLEMTERRAAQLHQIQEEMAGLRVEVADLEKQLPRGRELPALIRLLTHRAETYGISLNTLAPQKPISKGLYDEIEYNVTLTSSFHSLGRFLTAMGKGDRLFAARDIAWSPAASKSDPSKTVNVTFKLVSFKYHE